MQDYRLFVMNDNQLITINIHQSLHFSCFCPWNAIKYILFMIESMHFSVLSALVHRASWRHKNNTNEFGQTTPMKINNNHLEIVRFIVAAVAFARFSAKHTR